MPSRSRGKTQLPWSDHSVRPRGPSRSSRLEPRNSKARPSNRSWRRWPAMRRPRHPAPVPSPERQAGRHSGSAQHAVAVFADGNVLGFPKRPQGHLARRLHHLNENGNGEGEEVTRERLDHPCTSVVSTIAIAVAGAITVAIAVRVAIEAAAIAVVIVTTVFGAADLVGGQVVGSVNESD